MSEGILSEICEFLLPKEGGVFGLKWDAWVAVGTLALAFVTYGIIKETRRAELARRKESEDERRRSAEYLAVIFDHELYLTIETAKLTISMLETGPADEQQYVLREYRSRLHIPFMTRFADRLTVFDGDTAALVAIVISGINQAKLNVTPDGPVEKNIFSFMVNAAVGEAKRLASNAEAARNVLHRHFPKSSAIGVTPMHIFGTERNRDKL